MIQLVLHHTELLVLLDALHVRTLVGLDFTQLMPATSDERRAALEQGQERLALRGLLRREADGTCTLDSTLLLMAGVLVFPQLAVLTTRKDRTGQAQLWFHAYSDGLVIEHTLPDAEHHRLMSLPSPAALTARLLDLWPAPAAPMPTISCVLPAEILGAVVEAIDAGQHGEAEQLVVAQDLAPQARGRLLNTLERRHFSGSTALLRCDGETITAARNPGFIVGPQSTWLVSSALPGSALLRLEMIDGPQLQGRLTSWMQSLYPLQRAA